MRRILHNLAITLIATLLSLAPSSSMAAPKHTGIQGRSIAIYTPPPVMVAPGFWVGVPAQFRTSAPTMIAIYSARNGRHIATIATEGGRASFAAALPPGNYIVVPDALEMGPDCYARTRPIEVTVRPRRVTSLDIVYRTSDDCAQPYFAVRADTEQ